MFRKDGYFDESGMMVYESANSLKFVKITNKKDESFVFVPTDIMSHFK